MSQVSSVHVVLATGPGIASPNIDRFDVNRSDLAEHAASRLDELVARIDFADAGQPSLLDKAMVDGPHKSSLTVTFLDGTTQKLSFRGSPSSSAVQNLVGFVMQTARA